MQTYHQASCSGRRNCAQDTKARKPPDVILLGPEWPERALLRAQLIEGGHDVMATDAWPIPHMFQPRAARPRALVIDLRGLSNPQQVLDDARSLLAPGRVLVVSALGSLRAADIRQLGFNVIERPTTIGEIVATTNSILSRTSSE
jgi:hypothetical protein